MAHDLEAFELDIIVCRIDAGFLLGNHQLITDRVDTIEVWKQKPPLPTLGHDDAVAFRVELVRRIDGFGVSQHVNGIVKVVQLFRTNRWETRVATARADAVLDNLLGNRPRRCGNRADASAQVTMLVQRNEHTCTPREQRRVDIVGECCRPPRFHKRLDGQTGQRDMRIDAFRHFHPLLPHQTTKRRQPLSNLWLLHRKTRCDAVADAERPLV